MKNSERQKKLDKSKWETSKIHSQDLSGKMYYCLKCERMNCTHNCNATQKEREEKSLCAVAYNKYCRAKNGRI